MQKCMKKGVKKKSGEKKGLQRKEKVKKQVVIKVPKTKCLFVNNKKIHKEFNFSSVFFEKKKNKLFKHW